MRYSSAVVLSTLAAGQAAAAHNARHASFHARRQAEAKRSYGEVDWAKVSYDLNDVNWSSVFNPPAATPTPAPEAEPKPKPVAVAEVKTSAAPEPAYTPTPEPTSETPKPSSTKAAEPTPTPTEEADSGLGDLLDDVGDFVTDLLHGVESIIESLGVSKAGVNSETDNGKIWIGDSDWEAEFINDSNEDLVLFCWESAGFTGMSINVNQPLISVGLQSGKKTKLGFAPNVPSACAPAYSSSKLAMFGGLDQTWWEVTFGQHGAFDVSRNVNMSGSNISSKGSKCTSDMETCVFKCTNGKNSCEAGSDYDLFNCGASNGGGGGYDPIMAGTGGGCAMGSSKETVVVTFS